MSSFDGYFNEEDSSQLPYGDRFFAEEEEKIKRAQRMKAAANIFSHNDRNFIPPAGEHLYEAGLLDAKTANKYHRNGIHSKDYVRLRSEGVNPDKSKNIPIQSERQRREREDVLSLAAVGLGSAGALGGTAALANGLLSGKDKKKKKN